MAEGLAESLHGLGEVSEFQVISYFKNAPNRIVLTVGYAETLENGFMGVWGRQGGWQGAGGVQGRARLVNTARMDCGSRYKRQ